MAAQRSASEMIRLLRSLTSCQSSSRKYHLLFRHFSADTDHTSLQELHPGDDLAVTRALQLLQSPEDTWNRDELKTLLLPENESSKSSVKRLCFIASNIQSADRTLGFLNFVRTSSSEEHVLSLVRSACERVLTTAASEPHSEEKLYALYNVAREKGIPLTAKATTHLLCRFGQAEMIDELVSVFHEIDPEVKNTKVCNAYLRGLFKSRKAREALKVLDEMLERDSELPPSDITGEIVFSALLRREYTETVTEDEIAELVMKFGRHGIFPDSIKLSKLITRLSKSGKIEKAWDFLQEIFRLGGPVEAGLCNALLSGFGWANDINKMNKLLRKMKEMNVEPNIVTFGILINHLCKFRRLDDALEVFKQMNGEGNDGISICVKPDAVIYNTLINGLCKVGRQQEGLELLEKMKLQSGCSPTTVTYNCLIDNYCKSGEIERARALFDRMSEEGLVPNEITLNILVDGMSKNGRINSAVQLLREMKVIGLTPSAKIYTSLIYAFCAVNNIAKAMELFDEMSNNSGIAPDAIAYYTLISGLAQAGRLDDANRVTLKLKEVGFSLDIACYNTLISCFCKKNKTTDAYNLFKEMESAGVKPDTVTYNTLIAHFSKHKDFRKACELMELMQREGHTPTVVTCGALIHAHCLNGEVEEAMKIFEQMRSFSSRIPPNTIIYNILIDSLCKKGEVEQAASLMDDMIGRKVRPNTNTFNALLRGLQGKNLLEKALKLMDLMTEQACKPDYITMEVLTEWLSAVGQLEKLKRFLKGYEVSSSMT
ncbi:hypothetical protein SAY87_001051 [Trapa incisa]|uniref:Pentatricopeptide repeat-containing protein n=1 Tax=Trapa incisa TaxID=236973 RepID=A0AAN7JHD2_9MYRT|nr:hypothetical protein SAY87_001051 [Trapa incisa]